MPLLIIFVQIFKFVMEYCLALQRDVAIIDGEAVTSCSNSITHSRVPIAVALYYTFLHCSFVTAVALRLWSFLMHLIALAATSLNALDGSVWTAFCHVVGLHPAPSLQRRSAPAHRPCHDPAWLLFICLPPSNLLRTYIQLSPRFVLKLPERLHCQAWINFVCHTN